MEAGKSYVLEEGKLLTEGMSKEQLENSFAAISHKHNVEDIEQIYQAFQIHELNYTVNKQVPGNSFFQVSADINISGIPMYLMGFEVYISAGGEEALSAYFTPTQLMLSPYSNYKKIDAHFQNTVSSSLYVSRVKFRLTYIKQ